jgi:hypothetical protein
MTRYGSWSSRGLKAAGTTVNAHPLWDMAKLLDEGEQTATRFQSEARAALSTLVAGWVGADAAAAHRVVTATASKAGTTAIEATSASAIVSAFADSMARSTYEVSIMPANDPPRASDYIVKGLLSPVAATAEYFADAHQAEQQRQSLVSKISAMDSQGQQVASDLGTAFKTGSLEPPPTPPPAALPQGASTRGASGPSGGTAPSASGGSGGPSSGSTTGTPARGTPSGVGVDPVQSGGSTPPPASPTAQPVPTPTPTPGGGGQPIPQSSPTAPPVTTTVPGTPTTPPVSIPPAASGGSVAGALPGALLGGAVLTGGASAALGSSTLGLPATVKGGWAPGVAPGEALPASPAGSSGTSSTARGTTSVGRGVGGAGEAAPGSTTTGRPGSYGSRPGMPRPGTGSAGSRTVSRTVGRGSSGTTYGEERVGQGGRTSTPRRGVIGEERPLGRGATGETAGRGGTTGGAGNRGPMGRGGRRRDEDDSLNERPHYLVESDDVWGDGRKVARSVLGDRPEIEGEDL